MTLPDVGRKGWACRYDLAPATNPQITPEGRYRSAKPLTSGTLAGLRLEKFRGRCREQASGFVRFVTSNEIPDILVELDGCRRVITSTDNGYRAAQASPELLELLTG